MKVEDKTQFDKNIKRRNIKMLLFHFSTIFNIAKLFLAVLHKKGISLYNFIFKKGGLYHKFHNIKVHKIIINKVS
ncbi:hypothetical protein K502DRAFT_191728 [Neoconidiobolus thromboides FSU 785]|nr:hypothetical protein K502DRAFT_191728 [Neoconidiobolus thromboides FSU 785]